VGTRRADEDGEPVDPDLAKRDARRRRIRTRFQAFVSACTVLVVIVPLILEQLDGKVPAHVYAYLAGAAVAITQGAAIVTRVMNTPAVSNFIDKYIPWLSADPEV
jgi:hypothetical protein